MTSLMSSWNFQWGWVAVLLAAVVAVCVVTYIEGRDE